jgi:hypothetical protein
MKVEMRCELGNFSPYVSKVYVNGKLLVPSISQNYCNHSPDGFSWGYEGSGPHQLALAVLMELFPTVPPEHLQYKYFCRQIISQFPFSTSFSVTFNFNPADYIWKP